MSLLDTFRTLWNLGQQPASEPTRPTRRPRRLTPTQIRQMAGGRVSLDRSGDIFGDVFSIVPPPSAELQWRTQDLDTKTLNTMSPARLLELMVDLSPEVSSGLWTFLRLCNPGWEAKALRPGAEEEEVDTTAQTALDEFLDSLTGVYTAEQEVPADTIINMLFLGAFLRGAFLTELVLDEDGREPLNIATPDPYAVRFRKVRDERLGTVYQLGQFQGGVWVPLTVETIRYVPVDPMPGNPYGRALVSPALFTSLFLLGILHDLRRVVSQQGYPRIDLEVVSELLKEMMPAGVADDPDELQKWVDSVIDEVEKVYSKLEPDDAFVHMDIVKVNRPVGTVDAQSLGAIDSLIKALERMAARALKIMPLLMGVQQTTTETNANRQWEIQAASIKAIQHLLETSLEKTLRLALEVQGIQADVRFRFAELRAAERLRDAQTEEIEIRNAKAKYDHGWISQNQASEEVTGMPADQPAPRVSTGVGAPSNIPLDEETNGRLANELRATRIEIGRLISENGHHDKRSTSPAD